MTAADSGEEIGGDRGGAQGELREVDPARAGVQLVGDLILDLLEGGGALGRGEEGLAHRFRSLGGAHQQLDHVVHVDQRERARASSQLQLHALAHQLEEGEVLAVAGTEDPRRPHRAHLQPRRVREGQLLCARLALAVGLLGRERIFLLPGPLRARRAGGGERAAQDQAARPARHHRFADVTGALGVDLEEGLPSRRAADPGEVKDGVHARGGFAERGGFGDVALEQLQPRMGGEGSPQLGRAGGPHQTPHPVSISEQSPHQGTAHEASGTGHQAGHVWVTAYAAPP
jgi:hypothetical protein